MRQLSIDVETYRTIGLIVEAWTRPKHAKMTKARVVEILVKALPGMLSWEVIDEVIAQGLLAPEPGRPTKCRACGGLGTTRDGDSVIGCTRCPAGRRLNSQLQRVLDPGDKTG